MGFEARGQPLDCIARSCPVECAESCVAQAACQRLAHSELGSIVEACGSAVPFLAGSLCAWADKGALALQCMSPARILCHMLCHPFASWPVLRMHALEYCNFLLQGLALGYNVGLAQTTPGPMSQTRHRAWGPSSSRLPPWAASRRAWRRGWPMPACCWR